MLTWQELRQLSDAELAKKDLAEVNLACADGLPGTDQEAMNVLSARLEEWTERARSAQAFANPNGKSLAFSQMQRLVEVLHDAMRAVGNISTDKFLADDQGADVLILDPLNGTSCSRSAFLVLCVSIGRRLGYPLKLLATRAEKFFYLFGRWDDGKGEQFNIDVSGEGFCSRPDEHYRTGAHEVPALPIKKSRLMALLKPQEELAFFLGGRGFKWEALGDYEKAMDSFAWASAINTWNAGLRAILTQAIQRWRANLNLRIPPHFPHLELRFPFRRYPLGLPYELEQAIILNEVLEMLLREPGYEKQFWEPMRQRLPMAIKPETVYVEYSPIGHQVKMTFKTDPNPQEGEKDRSSPSPHGTPTVAAEPPKPANDGPLTAERLVRMSDEELAKIDIAEMNLVCAKGLPGTHNLDIPACLRKIDEWTEFVRDITERNLPRFENCREEYNNSWATFRVVTMILTLQRKFGMKYNEDRKKNLEGNDFFNRPEDIFIHGILSGNGGTCASIPVLCVAVGRKLGYPLTLVHTARHQFFRWDEPGSERVNFEAASDLGLNTYADEHYRHWPVEVPSDIEERFCFLQNQTSRQDLSSFLMARSNCWVGNGNYSKGLKCTGWASLLDLEDNGPFNFLVPKLQEWREKLKPDLPDGLPQTRFTFPKRVWLNLPIEMERDIVFFSVTEDLLREFRFKKLVEYVKAKRRLPNWAPKEIKITYPDRMMYDI